MDHNVSPPCLPLPRKRSPDGASPDWGCGHLIAAYYSFIYPERMEGWVGLVGRPIASVYPHCFLKRENVASFCLKVWISMQVNETFLTVLQCMCGTNGWREVRIIVVQQNCWVVVNPICWCSQLVSTVNRFCCNAKAHDAVRRRNSCAKTASPTPQPVHLGIDWWGWNPAPVFLYLLLLSFIVNKWEKT